MKPAIVTAWLFGMGIITYRFVARQHQPPIPGNMLAASGTFGLLALLAEYQPAAGAAAAIAWGLDLAALLGLFPESVAGPQGSGTRRRLPTGTGQAPGTTTAAGRGSGG